MNRHSRIAASAGIGLCSLTLVLASPIGVAMASSNEPAIVVNRETVQAELSSSGSLDAARLFSQLVVTGDGTYKLLDPTSGKNIRDLDGFSAPDVKNGMADYSIDVHGKTTRRTVSDFTGKLPLTVKAEYTLDGKRMSAQDVVGKSGTLDVRYTVENVSATPTQLSFAVAGKQVTKTVDLVTPFVGQLSLTLPPSFTDIDAVRADVAGDGRGGQLLTWTMVLFEPIGQVKQSFGYTARVKSAKVPAATVQAVPVSPNKKPELAYGEKGFLDGSDAAGNVAFAGATIDSNMIKLRDGAGDLLAGLTKLAAGAAALNDGLAGEAAPGAHQLADGLGAISAGLDQLAATTGLPAAKAGLLLLRLGIDHPVGAAGPKDPGGLVQGLTAIAAGLGQVNAGLPRAKGGVDQLSAGLTSAIDPKNLTTGIAGLKAGVSGASALATGAYGALCAVPATPGCSSLKTALGALAQVSGGLDHPVGALGASDQGGLLQQSTAARDGLNQVSAGLAAAIGGVAALQAGTNAALAGVKTRLLGGVNQLIAGVTTAVAGISQLSAGAKSAAAGSVTLADGLDSAADGSGQIADGLTAAKGGNVKVHDGLESLRTQAAVPLTTAGQSTAASYAERYATMKALDEKAADGALPYGAPEGASGSAAYLFTLAAATTNTRDNTTRGLAAIVLLSLASLTGFVVRRRALG
ncbi:MAG: hypothetical protein JJD92_09595 [Frankiaceae bacterium]|nr:hypothetical protein [Frankiaceae bacterium]